MSLQGMNVVESGTLAPEEAKKMQNDSEDKIDGPDVSTQNGESKPGSVRLMAQLARAASRLLQTSTLEERNAALQAYKDGLVHFREEIEAANQRELEAAKVAVAAGELSSPVFQRLNCRGQKFETLLSGLDSLIAKDDPLGVCDLATELGSHLELFRLSCPIGVIAVIYEARPEAAVQVAGLALKTGNALLLKGGKEARETNRAVFKALRWGLEKAASAAISREVLQLIEDRQEVTELLQLDDEVDLVVPRGSNSLVKYIKENTRIPVLGHADGICHIYVDAAADLGKAAKIVADSKLQYVAACNTVESLLVHREILPTFLPAIISQLALRGVTFKVDSAALEVLKTQAVHTLEAHAQFVAVASEHDFHTEWLAPVLAVKTVDSLQEAIAHINSHGSHHTDCIITENKAHAEQFMKGVDSAGCYCNCSTRFADGYRYGFGAEVGVSTNKIHARGPVGLQGLVTYKYCLYGDGHTVGDFEEGRARYTHRPLATDKPRSERQLAN
ncbi:gamma-glutamyl phosphate reductase, putative [Toxoplasma gondii ME49]|uniref:glutamate-5-semialdehyde dehydrogenase n=19 Tax=Toxoplasma gondii TaxID=5811 RepID=B9PHW6_TOXGV|nr:gamma-glutamyl phosphate reductase, putative [Toxoplasma gondii ME49]EPR64762.1 putative gamma-glutamyl phosphate reductase [Toxoplasma gondii GT1]ESS36236.1 putative gamma-glutamyl phosphate reductase [Toxoplasma gondii VEG]KAF4642277.1 putative gamma-glutamyl phosphate reductase [Toxoplasma gondii]KFG43667.1 putative gamma-glutamyl phosphate reductase [Toxoplasma gondii GAB2-2007-GAL-DOM2]KFG52156.1 putative gamma-glutamyl phosphate reductase [Toxoplasma gondii p89]KFG61609.1 putative ga|eukprot:XP_002365721.1 gamma-glutamyl phosphate reductase, putative [Toxoplasma gondii ME49]